MPVVGQRAARQQRAHMLCKRLRRLPARQARPLNVAKFVRNAGNCVTGIVDHDRQQKRHVVRHVQRPVCRQIPFPPEVAFLSRLRVRGNHRHEKRAFPDLLPDRRIPGIAAAQFVLVEPDLETRRAQGLANASCCFGVLRGLAEKDCFGGGTHGPAGVHGHHSNRRREHLNFGSRQLFEMN